MQIEAVEPGLSGPTNKPRRPCATLFGECLPKLVSPVCRKNGFFSAGLVLDWSNIVGEKYAKECRPLRVSGKFPHCCLHVGASRATAVQLTYVVPQLLERIRQYFGRSVIETIRFVNCDFSGVTNIVLKTAGSQRDRIPQNPPQDSHINETGLYAPLATALNRLAFAIESDQQPGTSVRSPIDALGSRS
ncbi:MAG: DUF721 domain-containing protein [Holosporales bacterium]|jgi:hypothetical protein|nr:DUF721 domain-containing protein [Holosporales bacterium]